MIRINLLPPEYAQKQTQKEQKILFGGVAVLVTVLMVGFFAYKKSELARYDRDIQLKEAKLQEYQLTINRINEINQSKSRLETKKNAIVNLGNSRLIYPVFLDDFLPLIPSDVWITDFRLERQSGLNMDYKLTSKALSNYALATWITNLEQSSHFSSVKLDRISYEYPQGQEKGAPPILSFQLGLSYRHSGPMPLSGMN